MLARDTRDVERHRTTRIATDHVHSFSEWVGSRRGLQTCRGMAWLHLERRQVEGVADAVHGADDRYVGCASDFRNQIPEISLFDHDVGPEAIDKFLFGDHVRPPFQQEAQELERLRRERHRLPVPGELPAPLVEQELAEPNRHHASLRMSDGFPVTSHACVPTLSAPCCAAQQTPPGNRPMEVRCASVSSYVNRTPGDVCTRR